MATCDGDGATPDPSQKNERVRGVIVERRGWYRSRVIDYTGGKRSYGRDHH